jgi:hypothetical protein
MHILLGVAKGRSSTGSPSSKLFPVSQHFHIPSTPMVFMAFARQISGRLLLWLWVTSSRTHSQLSLAPSIEYLIRSCPTQTAIEPTSSTLTTTSPQHIVGTVTRFSPWLGSWCTMRLFPMPSSNLTYAMYRLLTWLQTLWRSGLHLSHVPLFQTYSSYLCIFLIVSKSLRSHRPHKYIYYLSSDPPSMYYFRTYNALTVSHLGEVRR